MARVRGAFDGEHGDQLKGRGDHDADDIERHEHYVGADGGHPGVQARILHIEIRADGERDGRRREYQFYQRRETCDVARHRSVGHR